MGSYDKTERYYHQLSETETRRRHKEQKNNHLDVVSQQITRANNHHIYHHRANNINYDIQILKLFNNNSYSKFNIFLAIFLYFLLTNCISLCYTKETRYYHNDGDVINSKTSDTDDNQFESLVNKNFFSIFSGDIPVVNSVENQSTNQHSSSSSTINSRSSSSSSEPNIDDGDHYFRTLRFRPSSLNFREQPIGLPISETVFIENTGSDAIKFDSISGSTFYFYCSFFLDKVIPPGGNTSFTVYFLARELGSVVSTLHINTNQGIFTYMVSGFGVTNKYGLKTIKNARIPLNTTFTSLLKLHNPLNHSLQVTEIYTSDDDLHVDLPPLLDDDIDEEAVIAELNNSFTKVSGYNSSQRKRIDISNQTRRLWQLEGFETRSVAMVRFMGRHAGNHTAFVCIKLANGESNRPMLFVLPVEVEVSAQEGLFSPAASIHFDSAPIVVSTPAPPPASTSSSTASANSNQHTGDDPLSTGSFVVASSQPLSSPFHAASLASSIRSFDLYLTNTASTSIEIKNISSVRQNSALEITYKPNLTLPPNSAQLTKIAEIKFNGLKSKKASQNHGKIVVKTNSTVHSFQIGFDVDLNYGSLNYNSDQANFFVSDSNTEYTVQAIDLVNMFPFPIVIHKLALNKYAKRYFQVLDLNHPVYLGNNNNSNNSKKPKSMVKLKFLKSKFLNEQTTSSEKKTANNQNISWFQLEEHYKTLAKLTIHTNFTTFDLPLRIYDGLLKFKIIDEQSSNLVFDDDETVKREQEKDSTNHNDHFFSDGVLLNSKRVVQFEIINYNPIDIKIDNLELKKELDGSLILSDKKLWAHTNLSIRFVGFQALHDSLNSMLDVKNKHINDCSQKSVDIPAQSKLVANLIIENTHDNSNYYNYCSNTGDNCRNRLSSHFYRYNLNVSTKFERRNLNVEFKILNGTIELVSENNRKLNEILVSTYPSQQTNYPIYVKSSYETDLKISSIDFTEFGRMFSFDWQQTGSDGRLYGLVKANSVTLIGHINVNSKIACKKECYLGLDQSSTNGKRDSSSPPIIDIKSIDISNIDNLDELDSSFLSAIWHKSIRNEQPQTKSKSSQTTTKSQGQKSFGLDAKLLKLFTTRFESLQRNEGSFQPKLKLTMRSSDSSHNSEPDSDALSYAFDVRFSFTWPHFLAADNSLISLPPTQIHVEHKTADLNITNPSNYTVLMQISLLNGYTTRNRLGELVGKHAKLFYNADQLSKRYAKTSGSGKVFLASSAFTISQPTLPSSDSSSSTTSTVTATSIQLALGPNESANIQVKFRPEELGTHENVLIVRNNLTILDAYLIRAEAGSAELRIDDLEPAKTSILFNAKVSAIAANNFKLSDEANLMMLMQESDFELCKSDSDALPMRYERAKNVGMGQNDIDGQFSSRINGGDTDGFIIPSKYSLTDARLELLSLDSIAPNHPIYFERYHQFANSYKNSDGLYLRSLFVMKNVGNTHLIVYQTLFDGELCLSQGIRAAFCRPFTIPPYQSAILDVRYQPDFRQVHVSKRLTLVTNLGDLDYTIHVNIPIHMLTQCHDMILRPPLETFFYYMAFGISVAFVAFLALLAFHESRCLFRFEASTAKQIAANGDDNRCSVSLHDICAEYHLQMASKPVQIAGSTHSVESSHGGGKNGANNKSKVKSNESSSKGGKSKFSRAPVSAAPAPVKTPPNIAAVKLGVDNKQVTPPASPSGAAKRNQAKEQRKAKEKEEQVAPQKEQQQQQSDYSSSSTASQFVSVSPSISSTSTTSSSLLTIQTNTIHDISPSYSSSSTSSSSSSASSSPIISLDERQQSLRAAAKSISSEKQKSSNDSRRTSPPKASSPAASKNGGESEDKSRSSRNTLPRQQSDTTTNQKKTQNNPSESKIRPTLTTSNSLNSKPSKINISKPQYRPLVKTINTQQTTQTGSTTESSDDHETSSPRPSKVNIDLFSFISPSLSQQSSNNRARNGSKSSSSSTGSSSNQVKPAPAPVISPWKTNNNAAASSLNTANRDINMDDLDQLNAQFRQLQHQNHLQQLKQLAYLGGLNLLETTATTSDLSAFSSVPPNLSDDLVDKKTTSDESLEPSQDELATDSELFYLSFNNQDKSGQLSRSVSILSRGGDSNSSLNWQQQHFFKPIDPNDEEEDEDDYSGDDDELFVKIGGYESGETTSVSSRRSTPLDSDIWLLPTAAAKNKRSSNSSYRPYNDPDVDYDKMVQETEKFDKNVLFADINRPNSESTTRQVGPIRRPLNAASETPSNNSPVASARQTPPPQQIFKEFGPFNDYKLFDDTTLNSLWPTSSSSSSQQPWNSILLLQNDLNEASAASTVDSATRRLDQIKMLWSNDNENNANKKL